MVGRRRAVHSQYTHGFHVAHPCAPHLGRPLSCKARNEEKTPEQRHQAMTCVQRLKRVFNNDSIPIYLAEMKKQYRSKSRIKFNGDFHEATILPADLWVYTSNTEISSEAEASMQVSGNTITISIDKSAYPALKQITGDTLVYFETFAHDPTDGSSQYDYYPSYATFMSMPADKHFTDAENDASPSYIDLLSMSISL
jgi:hypothetical protein